MSQVAETIWGQISRNTKMACGARQPMSDKDRLVFCVTIQPNAKHKIEVTLDPADTYTVKLYKIRGTKVTIEKENESVYCENLSDVIYSMCNK